jgi:asparagine synthase (glutamine-hydrolysing)
MCGIVGVFSREGDDVVPLGLEMLRALRHRGPDGFGMMTKENVMVWSSEFSHLESVETTSPLFLGHARLAIVGEGAQPFLGCLDNLALVCNGEIYNWRELKKGLSEHEFSTTTDSEVLIHLIEESSEEDLVSAVREAVGQVDGDFALAARRGEEIVLARDFPGVKPLWLGHRDDVMAFASERKALWTAGIFEARPFPPGEVERWI